MPRYLIVNRAQGQIHFTVPPPVGSGRKFTAITLPVGQSVDILPWAGSVEACRRIAPLHDYQFRGLIEIHEEP